MDVTLHLNIDIEKATSDGRYVRGWAYVVTDADGPVVDFSGQQVRDIEVIRDAAHEFMDARISKSLHGKGDDGPAVVGEVVESLIVDDKIAKALGMSDPKRGWFVGVRVDNVAVQKRIASGELRQLSIGGRGSVEQLTQETA